YDTHPRGNDRIFLEGKRDVGDVTARQEDGRSGVVGLRRLDDEAHGLGPVEIVLTDVLTDLFERAVRTLVYPYIGMEPEQPHHALGLRRLFVDVAAAKGAIDRDTLDIEHIAVHQHVGDGMLIVQLVVRVRVEQHTDLLRRARRFGSAARSDEEGHSGEKKSGGAVDGGGGAAT